MPEHTTMIEMHSYFGRILTGHSLFRWEILALDENLFEDDPEKVGKGEFSFFNFISKLVDSHRAFTKKDYDSAREMIDDLKLGIETLRNNKICRFSTVFKAFEHLVDTSLITILLISKNNDKKYCLKLLDSLTASSELNEKEEAAILAVRSACYAMYSYKGTEEALDFIGRAIRKDPVTSFWRFLKATYLHKLRIVSNPIDAPTIEEKDLLKKVNEEEKSDPLFMVYLADVYRESACANSPKKFNFWFVPEESKNDSKVEIEEMFKQAKILYEEAHKLRPECPKIAFRCSQGLMKLPQKYQNIKFAKQIILDLIPNNEESGCGNFSAAHYYHKFGGKPDEAKKYLKTSMKLNVFNAHLNDVSLSFRKDPEECVKQLEKLLDIYEEAPKRKLIYSQIISYYLFANKKTELGDDDLSLICDCFTSYLKTGGSRSSLENHRSLFIQTEEAISLLDIVADEVKRARGNQKLKPDFREKLESFVHSLNFFNICAWKGRSQNLRRLILDGKIPAAKSRCPRPSHPTNQRNNSANNIPQKFNAGGEQNSMKWSESKMQARFARGQPRGGLRGAPVQNRGRGRGRNSIPPRPNILPKNEGIDVPEIAANRVAEDHVVKTKQKEAPPKTEQVNLESRSSRAEGVKRHDCIEKQGNDRSLEEYRSSRRRSSHDRHARRKKYSSSSSERSDHSRGRRHGRHQKYSESSATDDSYDRYSRKNRRSSSDSYGHRDHRRRLRYEKSSDKLRKRDRRHSSVNSDFASRERYRRHERKSQRSDRYRSITPSDSVSSEYEKKKSSRRNRGRSPSESEFSERCRKYETGSHGRGHYRSITPSGSVSSKCKNDKSSRHTEDRGLSKSEKREKESHRRAHRSITPSGSVSSKNKDKKQSRRTTDHSLSESESLKRYRKREKESHRRARGSITPSGSVSSKYETKKPSRGTRDGSLSESESSERYKKRGKESNRRSHHRSVTPSESASSEYEKRKSNRSIRNRSEAEFRRERSRKSEEDVKYLSEKIVDLSLFEDRK